MLATPSTMSAAVASPLRPAQPQSQQQSLRKNTLRKNMSITQTYYLAHKARAKLSKEAAQPDHDLRLLVGHANMLDTLMLELADAEREQERWFNQSVRSASSAAAKDRHIQWADRIEEEEEEEHYDEEDSSDSSDSEDEYDVQMSNAPAYVKAQQPEEMEVDDDLEEDYAQLELVRTPSHSVDASPLSPPELVDHDSESSDDESSMPPSPPTATLAAFSDKEMAEDESEQEEYEDYHYLPERNPARLVSAISVY